MIQMLYNFIRRCETINTITTKRLGEIEAELSILLKELSELPEGMLICAKNGNRYKWYNSIKNRPIYIPKSEFQLAEALARKQYLIARINDLQNEQMAISSYFQKLHSPNANMNKLLSNPGIVQLLSNQFTSFPDEISKWISADYPHNTNHPENLKHRSISGNVLRSKSEAIIDMTLFRYKISFWYEASLVLDGHTIYPDFTLLHPVSRKLLYWEHFGLLDDYAYRQSYLRKLDLYISNNIIPSINLITTYETKDCPFTVIDAEEIVRNYFL